MLKRTVFIMAALITACFVSACADDSTNSVANVIVTGSQQ